MKLYITMHVCLYVYVRKREIEREREREREREIYIYIYIADSQIVYTEMVAERKTEESIPYGSKKHRSST